MKRTGTSTKRTVSRSASPTRRTAKRVERGKTAKRSGKAVRSSGRARPAAKPAPEVQVAIKELDPLVKCGQGTSVQFLYRVDEKVEGRITHHLVFFDHHGWYCEHGRECPAVHRAKKYNGHIARAS